MAKYYGQIGFVDTVENPPGVWQEQVTLRTYRGDLIRNTRRLDNPGQVNDNITLSNEISVVCDPYAINNFHSIRFVTFMGAKWKVTSVEVEYPRLILTIGGVYNG